MDKGAWQATYSSWGHKESDTTEATLHACTHNVGRATITMVIHSNSEMCSVMPKMDSCYRSLVKIINPFA